VESVQAILTQLREAAAAEFGEKLDRVILYGSYARGDYGAESDLDVLILADIPNDQCWAWRKRLGPTVDALSLEYDLVVSVHVLDCETFRRWRGVVPFYQNVVREGVTLDA
jgi:predicted nucleotidyltransferase